MDRSGRTAKVYSKAGGQLKDDHIYSLFRSKDGHLWMGCLDGDLVEKTENGFRYYPVKNVQDIIELEDGENLTSGKIADSGKNAGSRKIAVGTADGIMLVTPGKEETEDLLYMNGVQDASANRYVLNMCKVGESLWIATDGGGIYILNLKGGECRQVTVKDGLPSNGVCSLTKGAFNTMWVGTENGLCKIDINTNKITSLKHIWELNKEYIRGAAKLTAGGKLILGSTDGAVKLDPGKLEDISYNAPVHLIGGSFSGKDEQERTAKLRRLMDKDQVLRLSHNENTFELYFESVNIRYQKDIAYQYQVDDGEWSNTSDNGNFRFVEVGSGTHIIRVRSVSKSSKNVLSDTSVKIVVAQPFWNTWWMWTVYVLLVIGAFIGAWRIHNLHTWYKQMVRSNSIGEGSAVSDDPDEAGDDQDENNAGNGFVDTVTKVVVEHLAEPDFSIEDLCRELGMSRTYLYVRLKTYTGESPQDFIRFIKMEKAAVLLAEGKSVTEVSEMVGFDNPKYFSTVFKKHFGVSPSRYKN
ncbi:MAG: helix-turn-helix domain-containing protein [Bacteroidales bacterium]|nr:helix-turn-helix domain-containing protein [Bacteroidales bacterium]